MARSRKSTKGKRSTRPKDRLTVRLSRGLIAYLRRWAFQQKVPVSAVVEEAVTKLCEELRRTRAKRFQQATVKQKSP